MILNSPYITGSITVTGNANVQGTLTVTGSLSGTATSASLALNSNLLQGTGSVGFATTASLLAVSSSQQQISSSLLNVIANYATTGSNSFRANQSITGSLVVSSTITAQTLVVQTITSSILYTSGSNVFGNALSNTQTFTGSVNITGSLNVVTTGTEFQVTNTGVAMGNVLTDNHSITGSLRVTGSTTVFAGYVGIGTTNPTGSLDVSENIYIRNSSGGVLYIPRMADQSRGLSIGEQTSLGSKSAVIRTAGGVSEHLFLDPGFNNSNIAGNIALVYANTGSVGIGTYLTGAKLEVQAGPNVEFSGTGYRLAIFSSTTAANADRPGITLGYDSTGGGIIAPATQAGTTNFLSFWTYNGSWAEKLRIAKEGNVGMGTATPNGPLDIVGTTYDGKYTISLIDSAAIAANIGGGIYFGGNYTGTTKTGWAGIVGKKDNATDGEYGGYMAFYTRTHGSAPAERMRITSAGYVGIGTTTSVYANYSKLIVAGGIAYNNNTDDEAPDNGYGQSFAKKINIVAGSGANTIYGAAGSEGALYVITGLNLTSNARFVDLVLYLGAASTTPVVVSSQTYLSPGTRAYTNSGENLTLSITGNSNTYTIRITGMGANERS